MAPAQGVLVAARANSPDHRGEPGVEELVQADGTPK